MNKRNDSVLPSVFFATALLGVAATAQASVDWGGALLFDGVNDFARIANASALPLGNHVYTQEFWVRLDAPQPGYSGGYNGFMLSRGSEGYLQANHMVALNGNAGLTHWGLDRDTGVSLTTGTWHHIAASWDGSTECLYLNGNLQWTLDAPSFAVTGGSMTLGAHNNGYGYFFKGALDEVRVWDVVRTAAEIQANFAQTVSSNSVGLVGYWQFNESSGQTLLDSTPNGQHLTLGANDQLAHDDPLRIASSITPVPEPSSWALMTAGAMALLAWCLRKQVAGHSHA